MTRHRTPGQVGAGVGREGGVTGRQLYPRFFAKAGAAVGFDFFRILQASKNHVRVH
jgi:hypothetical protein